LLINNVTLEEKNVQKRNELLFVVAVEQRERKKIVWSIDQIPGTGGVAACVILISFSLNMYTVGKLYKD